MISAILFDGFSVRFWWLIASFLHSPPLSVHFFSPIRETTERVGWIQRVFVAFAFKLLSWLYGELEKGNIIRNLSLACINCSIRMTNCGTIHLRIKAVKVFFINRPLLVCWNQLIILRFYKYITLVLSGKCFHFWTCKKSTDYFKKKKINRLKAF